MTEYSQDYHKSVSESSGSEPLPGSTKLKAKPKNPPPPPTVDAVFSAAANTGNKGKTHGSSGNGKDAARYSKANEPDADPISPFPRVEPGTDFVPHDTSQIAKDKLENEPYEPPWSEYDAILAASSDVQELANFLTMNTVRADTQSSDGREAAVNVNVVPTGRGWLGFNAFLDGVHRRREERIARRKANRRARRESSLSVASNDGALEVVNGADDRVLIDPTVAEPWNGIVQLNILAGNGRKYVGTGFMIGERTVITAGHCVFMHEAGGWAREITLSAGRNGNERPFGERMSDQFSTSPGWEDYATREDDYGAIFLDRPFDSVDGAAPFIFPFSVMDDSELRQEVVNLAGYPADIFHGWDSTLQAFHARALSAVEPKKLVYEIDTYGGQSGAPVWKYDPNSPFFRTVVGVHTNGLPFANSATRITPAIAAQFEDWLQQGG